MSTDTMTKTAIDTPLDASLAARILEEGYGPGAWHGADLRAALSGVTAQTAYSRPAPGRHNIAEIAAHHAFCVRSVTARLGGAVSEFPLEGEDWFELDDQRPISWSALTELVETLQRQLVKAASDARAKRSAPAMSDSDRLELLLGITCHAVYHAGQIQLIKVLGAK